MNIYVPDDLGARIEKVKDKFNWSEVAQHAFEQKLGELAAAKKHKNMNDVIDRLRAQKKDSHSEERKKGHASGCDWAMQVAVYDELRALEKFDEEQRRFQSSVDAGRESASAFSFCDKLVQALSFDNFTRANEFPGWDLVDDDDWCEGFIEGALEVWEAVKKEL